MGSILGRLSEVLAAIVSTWSGYWDTFNAFFETFASFGLSPMVKAIGQYGTAAPTPTTLVLGAIYVGARILPSMFFIYFILKKLFPRKPVWVWIGGAVLYRAMDITVFGIILGTKPTPDKVFRTVAYGPTTVYQTLTQLWANDLQHFFLVIAAFSVFFVLTWFMFYVVNATLWFITLTFKAEPFFSETSGKGHALWLSVIWLFYLVMIPAGIALVNTFIVFSVVVLNRSDIRQQQLANRMARPVRNVAGTGEYHQEMSARSRSEESSTPSGTVRVNQRTKQSEATKKRIEWVDE